MTPIKQLKDKLTSIADSIRGRTGETDKLTLDQMVEEIDYMPTGEDDNTYILVDEDGNEIPAVLTEEEVDLTATANDIRIGSVAVTDDGVIEGTKEIPSYHTYDGFRAVPKNQAFILPHNNYDYTELQAIFCLFNTTMTNSTAAVKVAINNNVYDIASTIALSSVVKDHDRRYVDFGVTNDTGKNCVIRYIMYKEIY